MSKIHKRTIKVLNLDPSTEINSEKEKGDKSNAQFIERNDGKKSKSSEEGKKEKLLQQMKMSSSHFQLTLVVDIMECLAGFCSQIKSRRCDKKQIGNINKSRCV